MREWDAPESYVDFAKDKQKSLKIIFPDQNLKKLIDIIRSGLPDDVNIEIGKGHMMYDSEEYFFDVLAHQDMERERANFELQNEIAMQVNRGDDQPLNSTRNLQPHANLVAGHLLNLALTTIAPIPGTVQHTYTAPIPSSILISSIANIPGLSTVVTTAPISNPNLISTVATVPNPVTIVTTAPISSPILISTVATVSNPVTIVTTAPILNPRLISTIVSNTHTGSILSTTSA